MFFSSIQSNLNIGREIHCLWDYIRLGKLNIDIKEKAYIQIEKLGFYMHCGFELLLKFSNH